ncbi:replication protein [Paenibacillus sp. FSL P2-0322]|uniref:replication protein n=1 Tax=Paenibacillus sp. FSL P2-0322 TaxID=2921628 RepID=UPI0030CE6A7F
MEHFTRFPNRSYDYILGAELTATQLKIVLAVCRWTYGWNREYCSLSLTELSELTGCSRRQIIRDIQTLVDTSFLVKGKEGRKNLLKFNEEIIEGP